MKIAKKVELRVSSTPQHKYKYIKAKVLLAFRGVVTSSLGARFFNKTFVYKTFGKMIFDFLEGANQVLLVQFCIFSFIRNFTNDINYFRSIMFPVLYNKRDLKLTKHLFQDHWPVKRKKMFIEYIKVQYFILKELRRSSKESEPDAFIFSLPNRKKDFKHALTMKTLLSEKYLKNYSEYQKVIGKITNKILFYFRIGRAELREEFEDLFYTTFSLMVHKRALVNRKTRWKRLTYRSIHLRRSFFRQRKALKGIASRLTSLLTFYDK